MHFGDGVVKQKKAVWPVQGINSWLINLKLSQHTYYNVLPLAALTHNVLFLSLNNLFYNLKVI